MTNLKSTLFATGLAVAAATSVSAATLNDSGTISAGDKVNLNTFLDPGETQTYNFTANGSLRVRDFISFSSLGYNDGDDLMLISFGYEGDAGNMSHTYESFEINGATTEASASLPGFVLEDGESFTLTWNYDGAGTDQTTNQTNFATAAVPVPAAGLLLLTALAGGAAASRRKKKA